MKNTFAEAQLFIFLIKISVPEDHLRRNACTEWVKGEFLVLSKRPQDLYGECLGIASLTVELYSINMHSQIPIHLEYH